MEQIYKDFEKTIKSKHSFRWTPKYKTVFPTTVKKDLVTEIASKVFEKLDWDIIHKDKETAEARRKNKYGTWTEKITVKVIHGNIVEVESCAVGNEMWDLGRNSKRVKLFEFAFKNEEKEFDAAKQIELEEEIERRDNWDDYVIPESLPQPKKRIEPTFAIPAIGGLLISIIFAYIIALISVNGIYIIGFFEALIGFAFGFSLKYLIRWGNFTDVEKLRYLILTMVAVFFFANQLFQYQIIIDKNNITDATFFDFIKFRLENGLKIKSLNTGWIGLILSWIFQVLFIYWIAILRAVSALIIFRMEKVPPEVVDFAYYHLIKEKSEQEVRQELYKMGWKSDSSQNEVFESIGAIEDRREFIRVT
jgi:hypothetical protein